MYLKWNSWSHYKDPKCLKASIHQPSMVNGPSSWMSCVPVLIMLGIWPLWSTTIFQGCILYRAAVKIKTRCVDRQSTDQMASEVIYKC